MAINNLATVMQQIALIEDAIERAKDAATNMPPVQGAAVAETALCDVATPLFKAMRLVREGKDAADTD